MNQTFTMTTYDDVDGERVRVKAEHTAPANGGYVRRWRDRTKTWEQVCDRLLDRGPTLTCGAEGGADDLAATVRRERRRALARARREEARRAL